MRWREHQMHEDDAGYRGAGDEGAARLQRREGGTLGELVSRLLAEALARGPRRRRRRPLEWTARPWARSSTWPTRRSSTPSSTARTGGRAVSFSCDVNVLLYASDTGSPVHETARRFLTQAAAGGDLFCLGWPTVMSYLRIATHPAIFSAPLSPAEALRNVEGLVARPHVRLLAEEAGFLDVYREVRAASRCAGTWCPMPTWRRC